ncbi:hypothetical protein Dthio_PD2153 [Desulfonatronospira thiodismutans ASO3-1]|uniref:Uncharacterized protein n=1 Tax=Desulfonatronospira thiodismutans ASO3-1 TaxID=555779 RepID=D6SPV1_9BACT|nr:hypothetical protein Dthio_PD2153 [Desulfonatronospira thiodismutans ASO3-1]
MNGIVMVLSKVARDPSAQKIAIEIIRRMLVKR